MYAFYDYCMNILHISRHLLLLAVSMVVASCGHIYAAQNSAFTKLSPFISVAPGAHLSVLQTSTFQLQGDFACHGDMTLSDGCVIDGQGFAFDLADGTLSIAQDAHVILRNVVIKNAGGAAVVCQNNTATLELNNVRWLLEDDVVFGAGALYMVNSCSFSGPAKFVYSSTMTSTIAADSQLILENSVTFSCDTSIASPLSFVDKTSSIILDEATLYASATSLALTKGTLQIKNHGFLKADPAGKGIRLGSGTVGQDMVCKIASGSFLHMQQGNLVYNNSDSSSWISDSLTSILMMHDFTKLVLLQSLYLGQGILRTEDEVILATEAGIFVEGSIQPLGILYHSDTTGLRKINFEQEEGIFHAWHKKLGDTAQTGTYRVRIGAIHG